MSENTSSASTRKPKGRSPSYPAIDLKSAIDRARQLYDLSRQHWMPVDDIARQWGYRSLNGPAALTLAALKKFGLLEDQGAGEARQARLTNLTVDILANPSPERRAEAIRQAALNPLVHQELWTKYGTDIPPDGTLRWELTRSREPSFTESGAEEFIREYRATLEFSQLDGARVEPQAPPEDSGSADDDQADRNDDRDQKQRRRVGGVTGATTAIPFPIREGSPVVLEGEFPISEASWDQIMTVLTAMKPLLTRKVADDRDDVEG